METQFEQDILSMSDELKAFAMRLAEGNEAVADDLLQESLLRIMTNADSYIAGTNLKAWSFTVMRNTHLNNLRRRVVEERYIRQKEKAISLFVDEERDNACDNETLYKNICELICSLPMEYSVPLRLLIKGYRYSEIADILALPLCTVKNRIHVARVRMRIIIEENPVKN